MRSSVTATRCRRRAVAFRAIGLAMTLAAPGCGTLLYGAEQRISVETDPPGAKIVVYPTMETHTSPVELTLSRTENYTLRVLHPGYAPESILLDIVPNDSRATWMILGSLGLGAPIDLATGAYYDLAPARHRLVLQRTPPASP